MGKLVSVFVILASEFIRISGFVIRVSRVAQAGHPAYPDPVTLTATSDRTDLKHWIDLRHRLHQVPELNYKEFKTAAIIRAELDALGIKYIAGVPDAPTATIAVLGDP